MCGALTETTNITQMINLLDSENVPLQIQVAMVNAFLNICKKISEKKKIICDKMIHTLIRLTLASCDPVQIQNYDSEIFKLAIECLSALSGKYDRKMYIPGETRDHVKVRDFLINQGGILALLMVSKLSLDEELRAMPDAICFDSLEVSDWEQQKSILESVKEDGGRQSMKDIVEETEGLASSTVSSTKAKGNIGFLFFGSSSGIQKLDKKLVESPHYLILEITPNIPRYMLERPDYTIDTMIADVEERISALNEEKEKREQEEEDRREQAFQEQMKGQQQKEIISMERKKKAEELFLRRLEEKKKQQDEITKKIEDENKVRLQQEEERKKVKIQELMKKKEEFEKKTFQVEMKKKKLEEEMKKSIEEENERKKLQRKVLEESYWSRVRAQEKERMEKERVEKLKQQAEMTPKQKEDALPACVERNSMDMNSISEDKSDRSKLLKTQNLNNATPSIVESPKSSTCSNFKENPMLKNYLPMRYSQYNQRPELNKGDKARQLSVEDLDSRKSDKEESVVLPYIDNNNKSKSRDKSNRSTKPKLFILNEAKAEEEINALNDDSSSPEPLLKHLLKHPNTVRNEDLEKSRKMTSLENLKAKNVNNLHLKESMTEKIHKEREKVVRHKDYYIGGLRPSLNNLNDYVNTGPYKIYLQGARKKSRLQHGKH
jgi:hypothetical protein